jgi:NitT/TauT family transport system substrate-binding protein
MRLAWAGACIKQSRISSVALSVLSVTVLAAGCQALGSGGSGGSSGAITVAVVPGIDNAPLRVAVQDGLFSQAGLDVTIQDYSSLSSEVQALTSGKVQIAEGDYTDFFYEQAAGRASLRLIADAYDATTNSVAILTLPNSGITSPLQLQGEAADVATPPAPSPIFQASTSVPYNIQTLAAEEVLQNDGVSPSSVNWTPMQSQNMLFALRSGRVKAILATEPYILEAEEQLGAVEVVDASSGVTSGLPLSGYFSLASYAHANPSAVQAFQGALEQAQADCAQRGPVQAALAHVAGMTTGDAALVTLGTYPTSLNVGQVQRVAELMYDSGMISNPLNVNALVTG